MYEGLESLARLGSWMGMTSEYPGRRNRQAIEAGPQNYKAPLWAWQYQPASMAPAAQPSADRVNKVASTAVLLQMLSWWPELQGLDLKLSSEWGSSYLCPQRWAGLFPISLTCSLVLKGLSVLNGDGLGGCRLLGPYIIDFWMRRMASEWDHWVHLLAWCCRNGLCSTNIYSLTCSDLLKTEMLVDYCKAL